MRIFWQRTTAFDREMLQRVVQLAAKEEKQAGHTTGKQDAVKKVADGLPGKNAQRVHRPA